MTDTGKRAADVFDLVEQDLRTGLTGVFSPAVDAFVRVDAIVSTTEEPAAVVWQFHAVHDGEFLGLAPTGTELVIEGVTVATPGPDGWQLARYIDWLSVAGQLGLTLSGRPVVASLPTS